MIGRRLGRWPCCRLLCAGLLVLSYPLLTDQFPQDMQVRVTIDQCDDWLRVTETYLLDDKQIGEARQQFFRLAALVPLLPESPALPADPRN